MIRDTNLKNSYVFTWISVGFSTFFAILMLSLRNAHLQLSGFTPELIAIPLLLMHIYYQFQVRKQRVAAFIGGLIAMMLSSTMVMLMSTAALSGGAPLIDTQLMASDVALGLDTRTFVVFVASHPWLGQVLNFAYHSSPGLMFVIMIILAWKRQFDRFWEFIYANCTTQLVCGLASIMMPAIGAFDHIGYPDEVTAALPPGAGTFYMEAFHSFRDTQSPVIRFLDLTGLVTFPSFHCCIALMTAWAMRGSRIMTTLAVIWNGLVIASTIPIGGHYATDLIAAILLWATVTLAIRRPRLRVSHRSATQQTAIPDLRG